jgi:beta-phosphoglucomutase-like phosphatase (HAD superfamily)
MIDESRSFQGRDIALTIAAVLFDLDGTLIDHDTAAALALTQILQRTPDLHHVDHALARLRWKKLEEQAMERYLSGELTFAGQRRLRITSLAAEFGLDAWETHDLTEVITSQPARAHAGPRGSALAATPGTC